MKYYIIVWLADTGKEATYAGPAACMVDAIAMGESRLAELGVKPAKLVRGYRYNDDKAVEVRLSSFE